MDTVRTYRFAVEIGVAPSRFAVPQLILAWTPVQQKLERARASVRETMKLPTQAFFEQQPFEEDVLRISRFVSNTYLFVFGAEAGLNKIHRP
jgi:hypothetical protein